MNAAKRGKPPATRATDLKRLSYEEIRDKFLAGPPANDEEALDYFVRLGMYIHSRWEAIGADTPEGQPMADDSNRWDECTDKEFDALRDGAEALVDREVARRRFAALMSQVLKEPWGAIVKGCSWAFMRAWEHFVGAIGLLLFGLLFVWVAPHVAKDIRSAFDETLPHDTRPDDAPANQVTQKEDG